MVQWFKVDRGTIQMWTFYYRMVQETEWHISGRVFATRQEVHSLLRRLVQTGYYRSDWCKYKVVRYY